MTRLLPLSLLALTACATVPPQPCVFDDAQAFNRALSVYTKADIPDPNRVWDKTHLTYRIEWVKAPVRNPPDVEVLAREAFNVWEPVSMFTFQLVPSDYEADITIRVGDYGRTSWLGQATAPPGRNHPNVWMALNLNSWAMQSLDWYLKYVIEHEIGHNLGSEHLGAFDRMNAIAVRRGPIVSRLFGDLSRNDPVQVLDLHGHLED